MSSTADNGSLVKVEYASSEHGSLLERGDKIRTTFFSRQLVQALVWCFPASWISKGGLIASMRYGSLPDLVDLRVPNMLVVAVTILSLFGPRSNNMALDSGWH